MVPVIQVATTTMATTTREATGTREAITTRETSTVDPFSKHTVACLSTFVFIHCQERREASLPGGFNLDPSQCHPKSYAPALIHAMGLPEHVPDLMCKILCQAQIRDARQHDVVKRVLAGKEQSAAAAASSAAASGGSGSAVAAAAAAAAASNGIGGSSAAASAAAAAASQGVYSSFAKSISTSAYNYVSGAQLSGVFTVGRLSVT